MKVARIQELPVSPRILGLPKFEGGEYYSFEKSEAGYTINVIALREDQGYIDIGFFYLDEELFDAPAHKVENYASNVLFLDKSEFIALGDFFDKIGTQQRNDDITRRYFQQIFDSTEFPLALSQGLLGMLCQAHIIYLYTPPKKQVIGLVTINFFTNEKIERTSFTVTVCSYTYQQLYQLDEKYQRYQHSSSNSIGVDFESLRGERFLCLESSGIREFADILKSLRE